MGMILVAVAIAYVGYEIRRRNKLARARLELDMELAGWDEQRRKQFAAKLEL